MRGQDFLPRGLPATSALEWTSQMQRCSCLFFFPSHLSPQFPKRNPRLQEPAECKSCTQPLN